MLVAGHEADFVCADPIANITIGSSPEDATNSHYHPELKRKLYSAFQEGDDGELAIAVPKEVSLKSTATTTSFLAALGDGTSHYVQQSQC